MYIVAKDSEGKTVKRAIVPDKAACWEDGEEMLATDLEIKRVIFFDEYFGFYNALSRPDYFKREDDQISVEDKQALLLLDSL